MADAEAPEIIEDAKGRKLTLKQPELLAEFRLVEAIGPETSRNQAWTNMAMLLVFLVAIDGIPVDQPRTKLEIEALLQRLGKAGYGAISLWFELRMEAAKQAAEAEIKRLNEAAVKN